MADNNNNHIKSEQYAKWLFKHRWYVLVGTVIAVFIMGIGLMYYKMNTSYRVWFNEGSDEVREYDKFRKRYAQDDVLIIAFDTEKRSVKLKDLPSDLSFPEKLTEKILYDKDNQLLRYNGIMTESNKNELIKASDNKDYHNAVELLYKRSNEKGAFNHNAVSTIQRLTNTFWKTKYITRVDSISNYSHTYVKGDSLKVKDLIGATELTQKQIKTVFSPYLNPSSSIVQVPGGEKEVNNKEVTLFSDFFSKLIQNAKDKISNLLKHYKRITLFSDFLSKIIPYSSEKISNLLIRDNLTQEERLDLVAETLRVKLPLDKRELREFLSQHVIDKRKSKKEKNKVLKTLLSHFFISEKEIQNHAQDILGIENEDKAKEFASTVAKTKFGYKNILKKYFPGLENKELTTGEMLLLKILPHLSTTHSLEQKVIELRSFMDKLPPNKEKLIKMLKPHVQKGKGSELLVSIAQTAFPPYFDSNLIKKWVHSKTLSKEEYLNLVSQLFIAELPLSDVELKEFTSKYVSQKEADKITRNLMDLVYYADDLPDEINISTFENVILKQLADEKDKKFVLSYYIKDVKKGHYTLIYPPIALKQQINTSTFEKDMLNKLIKKNDKDLILSLYKKSNNNYILASNLSVPEQSGLKDLIQTTKKLKLNAILNQVNGFLKIKEQAKEQIAMKEKLVKNLLVSSDGTTAQILLTPKLPDNAQAKNMDFLKRVKTILYNEEQRSGYHFHVAGLPEMSAAFTHYIAEDLKIMLPIMFGLVLLTMLLLFRSIWGVLLPVLVVVFSILGTLGVTGYIGYEGNNITSMVPNILMAVGIADTIHILTIFFRELHSGKSRQESMIFSIKMNLLPCFLTSLTTSLGFISLLSSVSPPIRVLGVIIAIGSLIAFIITVTLVPVLLTMLPFAKGKAHHKISAVRLTKGLGDFVINYRNPILIGFTLITVASIYFTTLIEVDNNPIKYFKKGTYFRDAMDFVNEKLKGANLMEVSINTVVVADLVRSNQFEKSVLATIEDIPELEQEKVRKIILSSYNSQGSFYTLKQDLPKKEKLRLNSLFEKWITKLYGSEKTFTIPNLIDEKEFGKHFISKIDNDKDKNSILSFYIKDKFYILKKDISSEERIELIDALKILPRSTTLIDKAVAIQNSTLSLTKWKRVLSLEILLNKEDGIKEPVFMKKVEALQNYLESKKNYSKFKVSNTNSVVDILKTVNQRFNENKPEAYRLPREKKLLAENLFLYTQSVPTGRDINNQISVDQSALRLTIRREITSSEENLEVIAAVNAYLDKNFKGYDYHITGRAVIFTYTTPKVTRNMVIGLILALIVITIVLIITFRSIKIGLLSLIPNIIPILIMFGAVGISGTPFNMGLSMVAIITLGIVVDDTIHFIAKYLISRKSGKDHVSSIYQVFHDVGSAITYTSVILTLGFGVMIFSNFLFNVRFGTFSALTMAVALFLDLLFLPALILLVVKKEDMIAGKEKANLIYK